MLKAAGLFQDLENYILELIPTLPQVRTLTFLLELDTIVLLHWYRWILSQQGTIFTDISVITVLLYSYKYVVSFLVVCYF